MQSNNQVSLVGRLGRDPEVRFTTTNKAVCQFSLATDNGKGKKPDWHTVEVWEKQAEACGEFLHKGSLVKVDGSIKYDQWKDKDTGENRYRTKVRADHVMFLEKKSGETEPEQSDLPFSEDDGDAPF